MVTVLGDSNDDDGSGIGFTALLHIINSIMIFW